MNIEHKMIKHGLVLTAEPNCERDCSDVWIHANDKNGHHCSSYACATDQGELANEDHPGLDYKLSRLQLSWLDSQEVRDWLDAVNY